MLDTNHVIVQALEHYNEGLKPLKDFVRYRAVIQELSCSLRTQKILLRNTCERLLTGLVDSESRLACLLDNPTSSAWTEEHLALRLHDRLQDAYSTYCELIHGLSVTLNHLNRNIGLDSQGQPQWVDTKSHKRHWKRFSTCLARKEHEALLSRITRDNQNLRDLTNDSLQFEPLRARRRSSQKTFKEIRDHAACLHSILKSALSCSCPLAHHANLQLERRSWTQPPCFRVAFSVASAELSSTWHDTEIKVLGSAIPTTPVSSSDTQPCNPHTTSRPASRDRSRTSTSDSLVQNNMLLSMERMKIKEKKRVSFAAMIPGLQMINMQLSNPGTADVKTIDRTGPANQQEENHIKVIGSLCLALQYNKSVPPRACLGRLGAEQPHYEVVALSQRQQDKDDSLTLHELMTHDPYALVMPGNGMNAAAGSTRLTRKARLQLAVILASTALQLHTTPWLHSSWSGKSIRFANGSLQYRFISKVFPEESPALEAPQPVFGPIRNQSIFGLGIILLELAMGKPLEHYKHLGQPGPFEDFMIASQLIQSIADEEGPGYLDAAQACIFCNFGSKAGNLDLDNDAFRQAVYEDVIVPLERDLEYFCRTV
ncbi:MAG: hypothetical protein Q9218_004618 [Villophora microphyllina]